MFNKYTVLPEFVRVKGNLPESANTNACWFFGEGERDLVKALASLHHAKLYRAAIPGIRDRIEMEFHARDHIDDRNVLFISKFSDFKTDIILYGLSYEPTRPLVVSPSFFNILSTVRDIAEMRKNNAFLPATKVDLGASSPHP